MLTLEFKETVHFDYSAFRISIFLGVLSQESGPCTIDLIF